MARTEAGTLGWFALYRSLHTHTLVSSQLLSELCLELRVQAGKRSLEIRYGRCSCTFTIHTPVRTTLNGNSSKTPRVHWTAFRLQISKRKNYSKICDLQCLLAFFFFALSIVNFYLILKRNPISNKWTYRWNPGTTGYWPLHHAIYELTPLGMLLVS